MRKALLIGVLASLLGPAAAEAGKFRVRARENAHYGKINVGTGRLIDVAGFASAFHIGIEQPWRHMVGLTLHRGRLTDDDSDDTFAETAIGVEGKYFPTRALEHWFVRAGVLATALDPAGPPKAGWVYGGSLATGIEHPLWKLGLAWEIGAKLAAGASGRAWRAWYAALGIHFYTFGGQ